MLPDLIELPRAQDICKGKNYIDDQCCAVEWLRRFFVASEYQRGAGYSPETVAAHDDLRRAIKVSKRFTVGRDLMVFNDDCGTPKKAIATVIEKTVLAMGYELVE